MDNLSVNKLSIEEQHMKKFIKVVVIVGVLVLLSLNAGLLAQEGHEHTGENRPELERESPIALNPSAGSEVGFVYEAFLSPHQEGGE
jgi:hypothetical protein